MNEFNIDNIRIEGRKNKWYVIDTEIRNDVTYYLFENETYGDETDAVIAIRQGEKYIEIGSTYDDIATGLDDLEL